jgi:hypothetical protein
MPDDADPDDAMVPIREPPVQAGRLVTLSETINRTLNTTMTDISPRASDTAKAVADLTHVKPVSTAMRWILYLLPSTVAAISAWAWFAKRVLELDTLAICAGIGAIATVVAVGGVVAKKVIEKKKDD